MPLRNIDPMEITLTGPFTIGEWLVDPATRRLRSGGKEVRLEPKVMQVLLCLAQNPGKVVSRETLEATVWAGTIVGYDALSASIIKIRKSINDDAFKPRYIETVSKTGYRLIAPVSSDHEITDHVSAENTDIKSEAIDKLPEHTRTSKLQHRKIWIAAIPVLLVLAIAVYIFHLPETENKSTVESKKQISVVVLPFENLSGDVKQDYFSEGITDDITTDLLQVKELRVVARQSAYFYLSKKFTLDDIKRELGVKYVVQGSVQKSDQQLRIYVKLTDVSDGHHIWANRFEGSVANFFKIQDDITRDVIDAMYMTLTKEESALIAQQPSSSFEAYDAFLQGQKLYRNRSKESYIDTIDAYKRAIELDPNFARAYGALGIIYTIGYLNHWADTTASETQDRALQLANKAFNLDPNSAQVNWALGYVHLYRREYAEAEAAVNRSISLLPEYADGYGLLAYISNWRNKPANAVRYIKKAITLNPYYTFDYSLNLGMAYYELGQYEDATSTLREALERNETSVYSRLYLAASYVRMGRKDDAQWEIQEVLVQLPNLTQKLLAANIMPYEDKRMLKQIQDDLRVAGIPDE